MMCWCVYVIFCLVFEFGQVEDFVNEVDDFYGGVFGILGGDLLCLNCFCFYIFRNLVSFLGCWCYDVVLQVRVGLL